MIGVILGTRPEIIKLAPVIWELRRRDAEFKLIHTGQHYDYNMSRVFFQQLDLNEPDYFLNAGSDSDARQTAKMMMSLEEIFDKDRLETVIVEGDTNSVLAGSIVAKKMRKTLAHVEAGARSFDKTMPEEVNRIVCDHLSDVLFAPNEICFANLIAENIPRQTITLSGNTQFASMHAVLDKTKGLKQAFDVPKKFILVTVHRQENTTPEKLAALTNLLAAFDEPKIFAVHPRTRKILAEKQLDKQLEKAGTLLTEPLGYAEMLHLASAASAVLTDSGGLQKESAALGKPVLIPRKVTEWADITESGHAGLIGLDKNSAKLAKKFLNTFNPKKLRTISEIDGNPAKKIVDELLA